MFNVILLLIILVIVTAILAKVYDGQLDTIVILCTTTLIINFVNLIYLHWTYKALRGFIIDVKKVAKETYDEVLELHKKARGLYRL